MKPYMMSLKEAAGAIQSGELAPRELTESLLERISDTELNINAWVTLDPEKALRMAEKTEPKSSPMPIMPGAMYER